MGDNKICNLNIPEDSNDVTNQDYVDSNFVKKQDMDEQIQSINQSLDLLKKE